MRQCLFLVFLIYWTEKCHTQENYEIQVYGSQTMTKSNTMFELHSNFFRTKKYCGASESYISCVT